MLKNWLKEYVVLNKREIIMVISLLLLGCTLGIVMYAFSSETIRTITINGAKEVLEISKSETYLKTNIIANGIRSNIILIVVLALLSMTLFGKWIIYIIVMLKGAALSFYTIVLFNIFGALWGIVTTLLLVVLVNVLYIPALIFLVINFLEINFNIFKTRIINSFNTCLYRSLIVIFFSFTVIFSSIIIENIASSIALNIYKLYIHGL